MTRVFIYIAARPSITASHGSRKEESNQQPSCCPGPSVPGPTCQSSLHDGQIDRNRTHRQCFFGYRMDVCFYLYGIVVWSSVGYWCHISLPFCHDITTAKTKKGTALKKTKISVGLLLSMCCIMALLPHLGPIQVILASIHISCTELLLNTSVPPLVDFKSRTKY